MNDSDFEKALKKAVQVHYGYDDDLIRRGDALKAIRAACIDEFVPPIKTDPPGGYRIMKALNAVWTVKAVVASTQENWRNAETEPPPPNTDVEVYCKALGVTVGYHRPLMDEWLTDDHHTLRNVTHWRPIPPPPEAEP